MSNNKKHREVYIIHTTDTKSSICKVLNEYVNEDEAFEDLKKLLVKETNEDNLLNELDNKGL